MKRAQVRALREFGEPLTQVLILCMFLPAKVLERVEAGTVRRTRRAAFWMMRLFTLAPSLGGVDSLVSLPVLTSHAMISAEHRQKMGVTEQLIRLSVGIEDGGDLISDLNQALARA